MEEKLMAVEVPRPVEITVAELSDEVVNVLKKAVAVKWEMRPSPVSASWSLIAHANLGWNIAPSVVISDGE